MNMIFDGMVSVNGYQSKMLKELEKKLPFDRCVIIDKDNDGQDHYDPSKYQRVHYDICAHDKYSEKYDWNQIIPLDRKTLEDMRPYEPMAEKILMRMYEVSFFHNPEAKAIYLRHLRFWNHVIETEKIDYIVITEVPHHGHDYVLYALARIKKIKLCILPVCQIRLRRMIGDTLEEIGRAVTEEYENHLKGTSQTVLAPDIEEFYQRKKYSNIGADQNSMMTPEEKRRMLNIIQTVYRQDVSAQNLMKAYKRLIKAPLKKLLEEKNAKAFQDQFYQCKKRVDYLHRARKKMRIMKSPSYYDKLAKDASDKDKYVVYFLHLQPEATTMPQAGVFVEQELAIEILAKSLEKRGILLYVKEHFVQQKRERDFYDTIASIRNVKLIKSEAGSKEIIMNSLAVATCTGTVTLEAIINGIPALVFGAVGLDQGPGIFPVGSMEDCEQVFQQIFDKDYCILEQEVRNYLKAFEMHTCRAYPDAMQKEVPGLTLAEASAQIVDAVTGFYGKLCKDENEGK